MSSQSDDWLLLPLQESDSYTRACYGNAHAGESPRVNGEAMNPVNRALVWHLIMSSYCDDWLLKFGNLWLEATTEARVDALRWVGGQAMSLHKVARWGSAPHFVLVA